MSAINQIHIGNYSLETGNKRTIQGYNRIKLDLRVQQALESGGNIIGMVMAVVFTMAMAVSVSVVVVVTMSGHFE